MTTATLRIDLQGRIDCLYTEAIDLRSLGKLEVTRATEIVFHPDQQAWEVRSVSSDDVLFAAPSREACLQWERENMQPGVTPPAEAPA